MEQALATQAHGHQIRPAWYRDRRVLAWAMFDFANTPYVVIVATVGFSTYFEDVVTRGARSGDFLWGLAGSISMVVVALTAPYMGALADATAAKRRLLFIYTLVVVVATGLLGTVKAGMVVWGMLLYILANIGFQGGQAFYNAFLPEVAREEDLGAVSGIGAAAGYVGALLSLFAALPFFWNGFEEGNLGNVRAMFVAVAVFFAVFSIPTFVLLRDAPRSRATLAASGFANSLRRLREDLTDLRRNRAPFLFLVSYLLYMDAITTLTTFVGIYARQTLHLDLPHIFSLFIISQLTAIPGSVILGKAADRFGAKPTITWLLVLWIVMLIMGILATGYATLVFMALLAGVATGALLSVSRSMMALLSPTDREGEFFGFYAVAGRISAIIGPVLFGATSSISGNQRLALGSLLIIMVAGLLVLRRVPVEEAAAGPIGEGGATP